MKNHIEEIHSERKITPEEKKIAMSLETLQYLEPKDKVFIVLVWRGLKTASPVSLPPGVPQKVVDELRQKVEKADMFFQEGPIITKREYGLREGRICYVANNQKDLKLILELWSGNKEIDPKVYKEIGRMSGYPNTAIEAYGQLWQKIEDSPENRIQPQILMVSEDEKIEKLKKEPELIPFAVLFYMSRANFESELEIVRKWAKEVKLVTPALYMSFINDFKKFRDRI